MITLAQIRELPAELLAQRSTQLIADAMPEQVALGVQGINLGIGYYQVQAMFKCR